MAVRSVSLLHFGKSAATDTKNSQKQGIDKYFEGISKSWAHEALILTKGREVRNGKFKAAEIACLSGSLISAVVTGVLLGKSVHKGKPSGKSVIGIITSLFLLAASAWFNKTNYQDALITAHTRGFETDGSLMTEEEKQKQKIEDIKFVQEQMHTNKENKAL